MNTTRILIVEDEALIADHLEILLREKGYTVTGICDEAGTVMTAIAAERPDLVLLDIMLKGALDGVDIAHTLRHKHGIPFVFITSSADEKTIERVKHTDPEGFILKPFQETDLLTQVDIILHRLRRSAGNTAEQAPGSIYVKDKHAWVKVLLGDILFVKAEDNYTLLCTAQQRYIVNRNLKSVEEHLPAGRFLRVHRSYIINTDCITRLLPNSVMVQDEEIPIGSTMRNELMKHIRTL